jgi:hypothetical protein
MTVLKLPLEVENFRDQSWHREPDLRVENAFEAERMIDRLGFCSALTDSRRPGPSLYIAVCGRRDAHTPRNVQKDPETKLAWNIKDELLRRGRVFYGKLAGNRSVFITRRLLPHFNALFGIGLRDPSTQLTQPARNILKVLAKEWELSSRDLRHASGITDRTVFNKAMTELQRGFKVLAVDVVYDPVFTYIWAPSESRFRDELRVKLSRKDGLRGIAHSYLAGAGMTYRGELARVTGLSNTEAGLGNWALVDEGFAVRLSPGVYQLIDKPIKE